MDKVDLLLKEAVAILFLEQVLTVSKHGSTVSVQCENGDQATVVFNWLSANCGDPKCPAQ